VRDYDALARAARSGRAGAYGTASRATRRDEAALDVLLRKLGLIVDRTRT